MTDCIRIERTLKSAPDVRPPLYKIRLITRAGDVLIPTREQEAAALSFMALFDPADPPDPDAPAPPR